MASDQRDLIDVFAEVARSLASMADVNDTLQQICDLAADVIPGAGDASVSLIVKGGRVQTPAYTDPVALEIDAAQYDTSEGPCLDAIWKAAEIRVDDFLEDDRWPAFRQTPLRLGIRTMTSFRLYVGDDTAGALNLYGREPAAFDDSSHRVGQVLAAHAAVALSHAQEIAGLTRALASRQAIGQAQGVLMERLKVTADQAFAMLRDASQQQNRKLVDIAERVLSTGALPPPP